MAVASLLSAGITQLQANCLTTDVVGDCVYITGPVSGGLYQVAKADSSNPVKMPAIGIIQSKITPTLCLVRLLGEAQGIYSGLTPNGVLFVGASGQPSHTPGLLEQVIGIATSIDRAFISPEYESGSGSGAGHVLHFGSRLLSVTATPRYLTPGYADTIADVEAIDEIPASVSGTLQNLRVIHNGLGIGGLITYTAYIDGLLTSLAVGMLASSPLGANTTTFVPITAGQRLSVLATKGVLAAGPRNVHATMEIR